MGLMVANRRVRRIATAPPAVAAANAQAVVTETDKAPQWLIPDTEGVQRQLHLGGPATTIRDLALGIVQRLHAIPDNDASELLFLRDCLQAGPARTALPCRLVAKDVSLGSAYHDSPVSAWLIEAYGCGDDSPTSSVSRGAQSSKTTSRSRAPSGRPSFGISPRSRAFNGFASDTDDDDDDNNDECEEVEGEKHEHEEYEEYEKKEYEKEKEEKEEEKKEREAHFQQQQQQQEEMMPSTQRASGSHPQEHHHLTLDNNRDSREDQQEVAPRWPCIFDDKRQCQKIDAFFHSEFDTWGMDVFSLAQISQDRSLQFVGWEVLRQGNHFQEFGLADKKVRTFLSAVESRYGDRKLVPYHNSLHAADVLHSVHRLLQHLGFGCYFSSLSRMALLLSAAVHDMGHDGRNNAFHINVQDHFALTYNDRSVLENYHIASAFKLLNDCPEANLLDVVSQDERVMLRKEMVDSVLATDMSHHFRGVENLKNFVEKLDRDPADWDEEPGAKSQLQMMLLHAADISNPGKPINLSDTWTDLLRQEFYSQGDLEIDLGLPVSPMCDRSVTKFAGSQVGFIQFIVKPTWDVLATISPTVEAVVSSEVATNLKIWKERKVQEDNEENKVAVTLALAETSPAHDREGGRRPSGRAAPEDDEEDENLTPEFYTETTETTEEGDEDENEAGVVSDDDLAASSRLVSSN